MAKIKVQIRKSWCECSINRIVLSTETFHGSHAAYAPYESWEVSVDETILYAYIYRAAYEAAAITLPGQFIGYYRTIKALPIFLLISFVSVFCEASPINF